MKISLTDKEYHEICAMFSDLMKKHNGDRDAVIEDAASHPLIVKIVRVIDEKMDEYRDSAIYDFLTQMYGKD